ncbi:hypothetical protein EII12_07270 [Buchananella hordeovulneris]|uniref:choice-of-anchor M domain-containing protein n=1 Tax=Buchananella hordeovulneris TaxID=52770 RepID=UPI000F5EC58B|nr:choice-of-anchor M domain-containing protein [Buchananella hordeovulneris]RRD51821.1 hypothetical protein EII12_07270 [Buchananella hordeovulneris]
MNLASLSRAGRRRVGLALAGALGLVSVLATPALAGPDQDRERITSQHVDAPVPAWNEGTRELSILAAEKSADDVVLWLSRGWGTYRGRPVAKYLYTVPSRVPALSFLGEPGTVLNLAPQDPGRGNAPIWAGFGADASIVGAAHEFEGGNYVLDLVDVRGPGQVEMFSHTAYGVTRFLSSHDLVHRTVFDPRHTHLNTTFSKPGRYELVYRAVARDADGQRLYASPPTPIVWQVGGTDPRTGQIKDFRAAFAASPTERTAAGQAAPSFGLHRLATLQNPGDEEHTEFVFDTGNPADTGRVIVTIDGFFLTEMPVENGRAAGSEMIGQAPSTFQAIFIPDADSGVARWASAPVRYQRAEEPVQVTTGTDELVEETPAEPAPAWDVDELPVSDPSVNVSITPVPDDEDEHTIRIQAADPTLRAAYKVAFFRGSTDVAPWCNVEGVLGAGGVSEVVEDLEGCTKGVTMVITIKPHPRSAAKPLRHEVKDIAVGSGTSYPLKLALRTAPAPSEPTATPTVSPTPSAQPTVNPTPQPTATPTATPAPDILDQPVSLTRGHVDVRLAQTGDAWQVLLKDDTYTAASSSVLRQLEQVTLAVPRLALRARPADTDPSFDFLGPVGTRNYLLPETQHTDLIWPGFSTEGIDYANFPAGIDYELRLASGPSDGRVVLYTHQDFGRRANVLFDSAAAKPTGTRAAASQPGVGRIHTVDPTHLHAAWAFTKPGTYEISVRALSGERELAPPRTLRFAVDPQAAAPTPAPDPSPTASVTPGPTASASPLPTAAPSPTPSAVPTPGGSPEPTPVPTEVPTPGPTPVPTEVPTPGPSQAPSPAPVVTPPPATGSVGSPAAPRGPASTGKQLPRTGADAVTLTLLAATFVAAGLAVRVAGRRRAR